jgi:hypothetical protein
MSMISTRRMKLLLPAACMLAAVAHAQTAVQLRVMQLDTVTAYQVTNTLGSQSQDIFTNGNPLAGMVHQPLFNGMANGAPVTGGYAVLGTFGAGRELTGPAPDFLGSNFGVGRLTFAAADAASNNTNLSLAGTNVSSLSYRPVTPTGTAFGLVGRSSGFDSFSVFDYSALLPGEAILVALAGSGGTDYVDRLQVRYGTSYATGLPFINFETQSSTGGVLTRSVLGSTTPSSLYGNLPGVSYLGLSLHRDMPTTANPNPGVQASVTFLDAAVNSTGSLRQLATYTFATSGQTFQGSGDFQSVFTSVAWTTAVPEPTSVPLMVLGLVALAGTRLRAPRPANRAA